MDLFTDKLYRCLAVAYQWEVAPVGVSNFDILLTVGIADVELNLQKTIEKKLW